MNWENLKSLVYHEDGSLRDIYVRAVTPADWKRWADYVSSNYPVDFSIGTTHAGNKIDFDYVDAYWQDSDKECPAASIHLGHIIVNTFFYAENEIENDISPREIRTLEDHQKLHEYLKSVSLLLSRPVELTEENYQDPKGVLMVVDGDNVSYPRK